MTSFQHVLRLCVIVSIAAAAIPAAQARPKVPRSVLKTFFETGDRPTQAQFSITSLDGDPSPIDPADFNFFIGTGGNHIFEGLAGAAMISDSSGHALPLAPGMVVGDVPTAGQFGSLIDSTINRLDDRYLLGLRFVRTDGVHYGYLDITIDSPLPAWPGYYGLTIHGWAFEDQPGTPIVTSFIPAPPTGCFALGIAAITACRRRR